MGEAHSNPDGVTRARSFRRTQTRSEGLLWSVLRAKLVCGLKFRRQQPIGPWIVDFACPAHRLVVEINGGYHDNIVESDLKRQKHLESLGWRVVRFTDKEVEDDCEAVARAIALELNLPFTFKQRKATGSGSKSSNTHKKRNI